jgi:hypothetical protein
VEANIFHPNNRISFHYISIVPIEKSIKPFDFHEKMDRLGYKKPFVFFFKKTKPGTMVKLVSLGFCTKPDRFLENEKPLL